MSTLSRQQVTENGDGSGECNKLQSTEISLIFSSCVCSVYEAYI